jgi:hypothetical protein
LLQALILLHPQKEVLELLESHGGQARKIVRASWLRAGGSRPWERGPRAGPRAPQ